jgi:uracil-DNA glycosylase
MKHITVASIPGFEEWRSIAREFLQARIPPHEIIWNNNEISDLFENNQKQDSMSSGPVSVPKDFLTLADAACCYKDENKYGRLYRILWRLAFENKNLLKLATDDDMMVLNGMVKNVRRDAYKITAFLRFREIKHENEEYFVAWYEPEHYTLERVMPFFQTRFRNMKWSILTPYRGAHWNGETLIYEDNPDPSLYPKDDTVEAQWLKYYASIFNPARLKKSAMLAQMPKKYWQNMPETALIPDMMKNAAGRTREMIEKSRKTGSLKDE